MSTLINLSRAAIIDYKAIAGDTFAPPPVSFTVNAVAEDFTGASLKFRVKMSDRIIKEITEADGIAVNGNALQYSMDASAVAKFAPGAYTYDVLKIDVAGITTTIQKGTITFVNDALK